MAAMTSMTAEQAAEFGKTLTFEKVWAALMEIGAKIERFSEEADRRHEETERVMKIASEEADRRHEETERVMKIASEEADRRHGETERVMKIASEEADRRHGETDLRFKEVAAQMKETDKRIEKVSTEIGHLHNSLGEMTETLISAHIEEKFKQYHMTRVFQRVPVYDETDQTVAEIDILMTNTDCAMAVEVKRNLRKKNVDFHLKRLAVVRQYPPDTVKINNKKLLGAVAGGTVPPAVAEYAWKAGMFVLELSGDSARLASAPSDFKPREW